VEKTKMKTIVLTILLCFLSVHISLAQWQADVRLTNDPTLSFTTSYNNARCIASSGDTVHVVWYDNRNGGYEIYYKRSIDGGISWEADSRLTNDVYFSSDPSISISGSVVHVVWDDERDGNDEIYYKRSTDGGSSWGIDTRLSNDSSLSRNPCVSASGSVVIVVWNDYNSLDIFYKRSTDGGISWGADTQLINDPAPSWYPAVSVSGSVVHVVWEEGRGGHANIYYKRSSDGGINWGLDTPLTNNDTAYSSSPSMSVSGSVVHVVWDDNRDGGINYGVYYKHSTDGGISWGLDTRVTNNIASTYSPSVSVSGSGVHVVWYVNRDGNFEIYYNHSTDGGTSWGANIRLTNNSAVSAKPFVSVSGSAVHVVWMDLRDGNYEIYYKRNPTGNVTGIENSNSEMPKEFLLEQNYPNPFNPATTIKYSIIKEGNVKLTVYNALGNKVVTIVNENKPVGNYSIQFNGSNLASGIYFYKLESGGYTDIKKFVLMK
jgi:hypothetical protein